MKKLVAVFAIAMVACAGTAFAAAKFVQPNADNIGVYKNEVRQMNETALTTVGAMDRLTVQSEGKSAFKVKTPDGTIGWVEKRFCASASGKAFTFDDAEVIGYLDNPTPIYIIDADNKDATPIKLDRSFADAMKSNVDRETIERSIR